MRSSDGRFRVRVGSRHLATLLTMCRESESLETGGLLVGRYSEGHDTAVVTRVWGPPKDSIRRQASFWRGTRGLQRKLDSLWRTQEYYLGEWHYHPSGAAQPSKTDIRQMVRIAESPEYNCLEPVLIVVGGTRPTELEVVAHVFPRHHSPIRLESPDPGSLYSGQPTLACRLGSSQKRANSPATRRK